MRRIICHYFEIEEDITVKQFFGTSQSGNLQDAVRGLNNPQLIMLLSNSEQFEEHVKTRVFDTSVIKKVPLSLVIGLFFCQLFCFTI